MLSDEAIASAFEQAQGLADENNSLRAELSKLRHAQLAALEKQTELELRLKAGGPGAEAGAVLEEFAELRGQLELLVRENSLLETAKNESERAVRDVTRQAAELQASLTEALAAATRAQREQEQAEMAGSAMRGEATAVAEARDEAEAERARERGRAKRLQQELVAARAEMSAAHRDRATAQQEAERVHAAAAVAAQEVALASSQSKAREEELVSRLQQATGEITLSQQQRAQVEEAAAARDAEARA